MLIETEHRIFHADDNFDSVLVTLFDAIREYCITDGLTFQMSNRTRSKLFRYKDSEGQYFVEFPKGDPTIYGIPIVINNSIGRKVILS